MQYRFLPFLLLLVFCFPVYSQYNWEPVNGPFGGDVTRLGSTPNGSLLAVTPNGLFRANNGAQLWMNGGNAGVDFHDFQSAGNVLYSLVATDTVHALFRSFDQGINWTNCNLSSSLTNPLVALPDSKLLFIRNGQLLRSLDSGTTWTQLPNVPPNATAMHWLGTVIVDTTTHALLYTLRTPQPVVYRTTDGNQWDSLTTVTWTMNDLAKVYNHHDTVYVSNGSGLLVRSVDRGSTWDSVTTITPTPIAITIGANRYFYYTQEYGLRRFPIDTLTLPHELAGSNSIRYTDLITPQGTAHVFASSYQYGIFKPGESLPYNSGLSAAHAIKFCGNRRDTLYCLYSGMVFRSANNGNNWTRISPIGRTHISFTVANDGVLLAGASNALYRSTDDGLNWQYVTSIGGNGMSVVEKAPNGTLYGITNGLMRSTDNGIIWSRIAFVTEHVLSLGFTETGGILGGTEHGIYYSTGANNSWMYRSLSSLEIHGFARDTSGAIFAACVDPVGTGSRGGIYKSNDNGATWRQLSPNQSVFALTTNYEGQIFFSTATNVYRMQPNGSYQTFTNGLPNGTPATCFFLHPVSGKLFMGTPRQGTYRTAQAMSDVSEPTISPAPLPVELRVNYPNPFNAQTRLIFAMPYAGSVRIKVYDVTGAEVATLFDGVWQAGYQTVNWSPQNLSSGVYFCRLESERNTVIRKLTYMK